MKAKETEASEVPSAEEEVEVTESPKHSKKILKAKETEASEETASEEVPPVIQEEVTEKTTKHLAKKKSSSKKSSEEEIIEKADDKPIGDVEIEQVESEANPIAETAEETTTTTASATDETKEEEVDASSSSSSTNKKVTIDETSGVTTVEEIQEIDDDSTTEIPPIDPRQIEEIKAARAKAEKFLSESGEFLSSYGVDVNEVKEEDKKEVRSKEDDAKLGGIDEDKEETKEAKVKDMNAYLDKILSGDDSEVVGGDATEEEEEEKMTPEQEKALQKEIAYAMDPTKPAMTEAQKDLMASYQLMMHIGNSASN